MRHNRLWDYTVIAGVWVGITYIVLGFPMTIWLICNWDILAVQPYLGRAL